MAEGTIGIKVTMEPTIAIIVALFEALGADIRSFRTPLERAVRDVAAPSIRKNFEAGGRPDAWVGLDDATVLQENAKGFTGARPLIRSGKLMKAASAQNAWAIDGPAGTATYKLDNPYYGGIHQQGSSPGKGFVPARPFAVLQDSDTDAVAKVFDIWLAERLVAAGF